MATSIHTGQHVLQGGCAARRRRTSGRIMHQVSVDAAEPRRWPMRPRKADRVLCCVLCGSSHACPAIGFMPFQLGQVLIAATISWRPTSSPAPPAATFPVADAERLGLRRPALDMCQWSQSASLCEKDDAWSSRQYTSTRVHVFAKPR